MFYVKRGGSGNNSGDTWDNAYPNLADPVQWAYLQQNRLAPVAHPGDTIRQIWIAEGTYTPWYAPADGVIERDKSFIIPQRLSIYGGFPHTASPSSHPTLDSRFSGGCKGTPCLSSTVLSGDLAGNDLAYDIAANKTDNVFHVVVAPDILKDSATVLDGITVAGGYADGNPTSYVTVGQRRIYKASGGGIYGEDAVLGLNNVVLRDNYASLYGGGFYGGGALGSAVLVGVNASGNKAKLGGGLAFADGESHLLNTVVTGNIADSLGGGFHVSQGAHNLTNTTVSGNYALKGGGLSSVETSLIRVNNSIVWGNEAEADVTAGRDSLNNVFLSSIDSIQYRASLVEGSMGGTSYGYWRKHFGLDSTRNSPVRNLDTDPMFVLSVTPPRNGQPVSGGGDYTTMTGSEVLGGANMDQYKNFFTPPLPDLNGQFDRAGNPRLYDVKLDIGAYESQTVPFVTTPVMYVKEGGSGNGDGSSWDNACDNVSDPLLWAAWQRAGTFGPVLPADTIRQIWVAAGTYRPKYKASRETMASVPITDRDKAFVLVNGVKLYGGFPKDPDISVHVTPESRFAPGCTVTAGNSCLAPTILSGDLGGNDASSNDKSDNAYHVVVATHEVPGALLDGFIVEGGYADGNEDIIVNAVAVHRKTGAGIYCAAAPLAASSPVFENVVVRENFAIYGGGGVYTDGSSPRFVASVITDNEAGLGGGIYLAGSGKPLFTEMIIGGNKAAFGGGFLITTFGEATFIDSRISGNGADSVAGGVVTANATLNLINVTVAGNRATTVCGGISVRGGCVAEISNSIVRGNVVVQSGTPDVQLTSRFGFMSATIPPVVTFTSCIVGGSGGGGAGWNANYGTDGGGNIDADPLFEAPVDPMVQRWQPSSGGDYRLKYCSPAINAGVNVLYTRPSGGFDLGGSPRVSAGTIDIGAYEKKLSPKLTNGVFHVKSACSGTGDGSSWDNAYGGLADPLHWADLQRKGTYGHAVAADETIDEIWVAEGTYLPKYKIADKDANQADTDDRDKAFTLVDGVKLYGGFPDHASNQYNFYLGSRGTIMSQFHATVLSGDLLGDDPSGGRNDNVHHVVAGADIADDGQTVLDGFIVTGGNANGNAVKVPLNGVELSRENGGGIALNQASPVLKNLSVEGNGAGKDGGGISAENSSSPRVNLVSFTDNHAAGDGGGIALTSSEPKFVGVIVSGNTATNGGGIMSDISKNPLFIDVLVSGNSATANGGGIATFGKGTPRFTNLTLGGNHAGSFGGGICVNNAQSRPLFENSIVSDNAAASGSDDVYLSGGGNPTFVRSLVAGSGGSGATTWLPAFGTDGGDNIDDDPMFINPLAPPQTSAAGDYRLINGSPALNAGENTLYEGALLATALHNTLSLANAKDPDGHDRLLDGAIDMGAFEKALAIKPQNGIFFVKSTPHGIADGSSWDNAYGNLADPLLWAAQQRSGYTGTVDPNDTIRQIWVAEGIHKPRHRAGGSTDNLDKAFVLVPGVKIYGGFPRNADNNNHMYLESRYSGNCQGNACLAPAILSADIGDDDTPLNFTTARTNNVRHIIIAADIPDDGQTVLDGFILSGGHANGSTSISVNTKSIHSDYGGAVYNVDAGPVYSNLTVTDNYAFDLGGGVYIESTSSQGVSPLFVGVSLTGNQAEVSGGAVYAKDDTTRLASCVATGNYAVQTGGAISVLNSEMKLMNVTMASNRSGGNGGGIYAYGPTTDMKVTNSIFRDNRTGMFSHSHNIFRDGGAGISYRFSHIEDCFLPPSVWDTNLGTNLGDNRDTDPMFRVVEPASSAPHSLGNYRLVPGSSAISSGDSTLYAHFFSPHLTNMQDEKDADGLVRFIAPGLERGAYEAPLLMPPTSRVMYVKHPDGAGRKDGADWANAYPNVGDPLRWAELQRKGMVPVVNGNDTICELWVAEGTYVPLHKTASRDNNGNITSNRHRAFILADGVKLYGGFPTGADDIHHNSLDKRDPALYPAILSGDLGGNDSAYHVVVASDLKVWKGRHALLDGFTVMSGKSESTGASHVAVNGNNIYGGTGAGLLAINSEVNLNSMTFTGNKSYESGGAIHVSDGSLTMTGGSVTGNRAALSGGAGGGGIYAVNSAVVLDRVSVTLNSVPSRGGAGGGGVYGSGGSFLVTGTEIRGNSATNGGGIYLGNARADLIDVLMAGNGSSATGNGGALYAFDGNIKMTNVTVGGNRTPVGATIRLGGTRGSMDFNNGIVWGNAGAPFSNGGQSTVVFRYSLVETCGSSGGWSCTYGTDGGDNLAGDPLFSTWVDPSNSIWQPTVTGDYRLQTSSPVINNGNLQLYMNAFTPALSNLNGSSDLGGVPRLTGPGIDRGAYESSVYQMAIKDFAVTDTYDSVNIDVLLNDVMNPACSTSTVTLGIVATHRPQNGSAKVDPATNTIVYTPAAGFDGLDQFLYYIKCNADSSAARVYVAVLKPVARNYFACDGATARLGVKNTDSYGGRIFKFDWYDDEFAVAAGNLLAADTSVLATVKVGSSVQSYWVEARHNAFVFPRYKIELRESDECGGAPSVCTTDGTLLFREDFGGNRASDPLVPSSGLASGTNYSYNPTMFPASDEYLLTKDFAGDPSRLPLADHTSPAASDRGYMMMVNATEKPELIYSAEIYDLCPGMKMHFSSWTGNLVKQAAGGIKPRLRFVLHDITTGDCIAEYYTGEVPSEPGTVGVWRLYGFTLPVESTRVHLEIYNDALTAGTGNDFAIDDVEMRFCLNPLTLTLPTRDTLDVCEGTTVTFDGAYTDDGTFGSDLALRLEYNPTDNLNDPASWTLVTGTEQLSANGAIGTVQQFKAAMSNIGYYRLVASDNSGGINKYYCRAMSRIIRLDVTESYIPPDIRLNVTPATGSLNLSSYLDSLDFPHRIDWLPASAFTNLTLGTIDVSGWSYLSGRTITTTSVLHNAVPVGRRHTCAAFPRTTTRQ